LDELTEREETTMSCYLRGIVAADINDVSVAVGGGDLVLLAMLGDEGEL
jgi:hypothetical protein